MLTHGSLLTTNSNFLSGDICPAGYFCPRGSSRPLPCKLGQYCPQAALDEPVGNCTAGYYCNDSSTVPDQFDCPIGHYCPSGTGIPVPCPQGKFSNTIKNTELADCRDCTPGSFCAGTGNFAPTDECAANYYCPGGQGTATPGEYLCTAGHFCKVGTPQPVRCENGTFQNEAGKSSCKSCPAGYYCDATNAAVVNATLCPPGHYCPSRTGDYRDFPCPERKYSSYSDANSRYFGVFDPLKQSMSISRKFVRITLWQGSDLQVTHQTSASW